MGADVATIKEEVAGLTARWLKVSLIEANGQEYAQILELAAPSPPWDSSSHDVLIAIPAAYADGAALDAFYLRLPYKYKDGAHPRVGGAVISVGGSQWQLVSWHYPDGKPWERGRDSLESHIMHCKGFFSHRGAVNDY